MSVWDELCPLSGITSGDGPRSLVNVDNQRQTAASIAAEIYAGHESDLALDELIEAISDALATTILDRNPLGYRWWLQDTVYRWRGFSTAVAIGHFKGDMGVCPIDATDSKVPSGVGVEVRRVRKSEGGWFNTVVITEKDGSEREEDQTSTCSAYSGGESLPNFFVLEGGWKYLEAWLDPSVSPSAKSQPLSLAGELYEIINSRVERRNAAGLSEMNYSGIDSTLEHKWQRSFLALRKGSTCAARGIASGARGRDLVPYLMRDFRCWMFARPDIWPGRPLPTPGPPYTFFLGQSLTTASNSFSRLPTEMTLLILPLLPLPSLLALAATCKILQNTIMHPEYLRQVLKEAILRREGSLRWILPVSSMPGEEDRAAATLSQWLHPCSSACANSSNEGPTLQSARQIIASPTFPHVAFVRACFSIEAGEGEGSMLNRHRIWKNVKQFDTLWRDYRMHGWQVNRFKC